MMDFFKNICKSVATKQIQINRFKAPALGNSLLVHVQDDCCTCPDNGLEIPKCSYVTGESARDHRTSHCYCHTQTAWRPPVYPQRTNSCCFLSLQGRLIYTAKHNDFLNSSLKRPVCICSLLNHCHSDQSWQVGRHVSDMTAVRLFEDYLVLLAREANREGIT